MRKALIVGIDHYEHIGPLRGCVRDAYAVDGVLGRNADHTRNFHTNVLTGTGPAELLPRIELRNAVRELFEGEGEVALLYFAGHGYLESTGGYLCATDTKTGDDGLALSEILIMANQSRYQNRVVILDSCHSGIAGAHPIHQRVAELNEGVTILTASAADQYAHEKNGAGVFTDLFVDALGGAAANLVGDITPGSVYAHIDQSLGPWGGQRPIFKTNVRSFVSLRRVTPPIELADLQKIAQLFPVEGHEIQLDPGFEPERPAPLDPKIPPPDPAKTEIFRILQRYNRLNLLVPVDAPHMWHAAMQEKTVRLTALGEHYRRLVAEELI